MVSVEVGIHGPRIRKTGMVAVIESGQSWAAGLVCSLLVASGITALAQNFEGPGPAMRITLQYSGAPTAAGIKPPAAAGAGPSARFASSPATTFVKVLPPSDPLPEGKGPFSGFWYELQDSKGVVKYRRIIGNPILPPGSTAPIIGNKAFSVTIPRPAEGDQLVIFSSPLVPGSESQPAEIISRITFARE